MPEIGVIQLVVIFLRHSWAFLKLIYLHFFLETKRDGRKKRPELGSEAANTRHRLWLSLGLACSQVLPFLSLSLLIQA